MFELALDIQSIKLVSELKSDQAGGSKTSLI